MRRFLPALLLLFAPLAFAQNQTIVTGTITDPSGIPYYPATISACLTPATLYPMVAGQQVNNNPGSNYCFGPVSTASNGSFLMSLWGNALITCSPACPSTQWLFTVVIPGPVAPVGFGPQQFTATITISGNSQDIGATLNAAGVSQLRPAGAATNATNLVGPGTITGTFSGTHTETGNVTFTGLLNAKSINNEIYVDGTTYACTAAGINSAIIAAASSIGGIAHVGSNCTGMTIASNLWAGVTNPVKVIWEPSATFAAQQILPSNTEFAGAGWQTVLTIGASANWTQPEAVFINAAYLTYGQVSGHDTGISIHDFFVDGTANTLATEVVGFQGADNSQIYNLYMKNISHNAIDLRDGSANDIHDNWCVGCGTFGAPYHAFGGGIKATNGIFLHNKFTRNHASGGGTNTDHFDIYGQASTGRCGFNVFSENTSDASPSQSYFLDTCNNNTFSVNTSRNALTQGFATTSGVSNLDGGAVKNTYAGNIINNPGAECYRLANNANNNSITGGTCILAQHEGILILDSSFNNVSSVQISGPGQATAATYSGIKTTNTGVATQTLNKFSNNPIQDLNTKMHYGVEITPAAGGTQFQNQVHDNTIIGGSAGSVGNGVQDTGTQTVEYCDQWSGATFFCAFYGMATLRPGNDNLTDLGLNGFRWRNFNLGGYLSPDGGTSQITLPFHSGLVGLNPPFAAGSTDVGSTALPFGNLWLGAATTNNFKLQPAATAGARTWVIPDWGANGSATQNQPFVITLTSQYTNSTTTFSNVAGGNTIQFAVAANQNYTASCHLYYQAAATGGLNIEFTGPASPTAVRYGMDLPTAITGVASGEADAFGTSIGAVSTAGAVNLDAMVSFSLLNGANAGTVNLLAKSSAAVQLQIQSGSWCRIQ